MARESTAQRLERLEARLKAYGISMEPELTEGGKKLDFIEHGSPEHATFLGLVEAKSDDDGDFVTFTSPKGKMYRLVDELGVVRHYPGTDPEKAARLVLRSKVNELENAPTVPEDAPPMWRPIDE